MKTYKQFNESVRDLMTSKSSEEIKKSLDDNIDILAKMGIEGGHFNNYDESYNYFKKYKKEIFKQLISDDNHIYDIYNDYIYKYVMSIPKKFNESVRDLMTPKSDEDIRKLLDKLKLREKLRKIKNDEFSDIYTEDEIDSMKEKIKIENKKIYEFLYEMLDGTTKMHGHNLVFSKIINGKSEWLFKQDDETGYLWVNYPLVWFVVEKKYDLNFEELQSIIKDWMENIPDWKNLTPFLSSR